MKMKLFTMLIVGMVAVLIVAGCGNSNKSTSSSNNTKSNDKAATEPAEKDKKETKVIKAGIGLNDQHPQYIGLLKFKEIVEEKTDGQITVQTFHSGKSVV